MWHRNLPSHWNNEWSLPKDNQPVKKQEQFLNNKEKDAGLLCNIGSPQSEYWAISSQIKKNLKQEEYGSVVVYWEYDPLKIWKSRKF